MTEPSDTAWELAHAIWTSALGTEIERVQDPHDAARLIDAALAKAWDEGLRAGFNMSAEGFNSEHRHFYGKWHHAANPYREHP